MDFSIIDQMFDDYKNEHPFEIDDILMNYYKKYGQELIDTVKEYIKQQSSGVSNYFKSNKDEVLVEHNLVSEYVNAFENLVMSVNDYLIDITFSDDEDDGYVTSLNIKPHDLFNIDINIIEQGVHKYGECYIDDFNKIKDLIVYVNKNKVLKKLYKDGSWHEIDFEELIYNIYDYVKNKSIFKTDYVSSLSSDDDMLLFKKIKNNCAEMLRDSFDKFRPNLNSTKQIRADFGKLIFCRNLLLFYQTGIMPGHDGFVDFSVDFSEYLEMIDDFKALYSRHFDETTFREGQSNFICNPEVYSSNYKLEAKKCIRQGNKLIAGFIVSCEDRMGYTQNDYLLHIEIDDINDSLSNYEMQINIIPHGKINQRLQLMRIDNWASEQTHKNIANTLSTTTHVHLYNEFDLLRGKTNGSFDIAYNLEGTGVEFETALKKFLDIIDFGIDISKTVYRSIVKAVNLNKSTEIEIKE